MIQEFDTVILTRDMPLQKLRKGEKTAVQKISADASKALTQYHWPGNVRELENVIQRAVVVAKGDAITVADLPNVIVGIALAIIAVCCAELAR